MKTGLVKQGNKAYLNIEFSRKFEDNYKIHMLEGNDIPGLLPVCAQNDEGKSRYRYTVTGMTAMEVKFELRGMKKEDISGFIGCLKKTVEALHKFMLNPDGLILYPKFLFCEGGKWRFCYVPIKKKPLSEEFHTLLEYFEEKIDEEDKEAILFVFSLHRATLQKNFDLVKILKESVTTQETRWQEYKEPDIFEDFDTGERVFMFGEDGTEKMGQPKAIRIREADEPASIWRRRPDKTKKNRRPLKDLIAETDGQGGEEGI